MTSSAVDCTTTESEEEKAVNKEERQAISFSLLILDCNVIERVVGR